MWLWRRPAVAVPIRPFAWEIPYAKGAALKTKKKKGKKKVLDTRGLLNSIEGVHVKGRIQGSSTLENSTLK